MFAVLILPIKIHFFNKRTSHDQIHFLGCHLG